MSEKILVLGASGTGKTTSLRNLDPKKTIIVQGRKKRLPFKNDKEFVEGKNRFVIETNEVLLKFIKKLASSKVDDTTIVIDDWNYLMLKEYMNMRNVNGFGKFEVMAFNLIDIVDFIDTIEKNLTFIFIAHTQKDADGELEFKAVGKFVSEKFNLEGTFETVFLANEDHTFSCNGIKPAKSPMGMFPEDEVENDMAMVIEKYNEFYN